MMLNKRGLKFCEFLEAFPRHFLFDGNMVRVSPDHRPKGFEESCLDGKPNFGVADPFSFYIWIQVFSSLFVLSSPSYTDTLIEIPSPKRTMNGQALYEPPMKKLALSLQQLMVYS
jgi:hypothetical protein